MLAQWKDDGLQVDTQDQQGSSALMAAVRQVSPKGDATHSCVAQGSEDCVAMLIESSADVDLQDSDGNTALHHADEANQPMMFKMLVEDGGAVRLDCLCCCAAVLACAGSELSECRIWSCVIIRGPSHELQQKASVCSPKAECT